MAVSKQHITKIKAVFSTLILCVFLLPSQTYSQQKEVVAQNGEGIYRLLTRHGLSASDYLNPFIELNRDKLGEDNTLLAGVTYVLPEITAEEPASSAGKTMMHFDIFGEDYADVEIESEQLKGAIYYLVSGHGGPDPGALGKYSDKVLSEDEYAYDVTLRLARSLIQKGATVYMITRDPDDGIRDATYLETDQDERCYPNEAIPLNQLRRLKQRTDAVNKLYLSNQGKFQRMIAIHVDARSTGENIDVFFYHDRRSTTGRTAANILKNTFRDKYEQYQPGRGYYGTVSNRNLYVVRNTYPVAVYIELGNINHLRDQQRIILTNNRQAMANWLTDGLITDFETNK